MLRALVVLVLFCLPLLAEAQTVTCPTCFVKQKVVVVAPPITVEQKVMVTEYVPVQVEKTVAVTYVPQAIDIGCLATAVSAFANCRSNGGRFLTCAAEGFSNYVSCTGVGGVRARMQYRQARRQNARAMRH